MCIGFLFYVYIRIILVKICNKYILSNQNYFFINGNYSSITEYELTGVLFTNGKCCNFMNYIDKNS